MMTLTMNAMSGSSKTQMHPLRKFAGKRFLGRRTATDIDEKEAPSLTTDVDKKSARVSTADVDEKPATSSTTASVPASSSTAGPVSEPSSTRSRIPTPSASSRRHTFSNRTNAVCSPSLSPQTRSQIPRSTTKRLSDEILTGSPTPNQDGRYPLSARNQRRLENQRRSDVEASQRPLWNSHNNEEPIRRTEMADTIMPTRFTSATLSSGARSNQRGIAGHGEDIPNFSWPPSPHPQPDRNDDKTPTRRQFTNLDDPGDIVDSPALAIHTVKKLNSYSPPVSQYGDISDMWEKSSAKTTGVASSISPRHIYGDYSFDASDETIGLALTSPIPVGGDIVYESATEASEPFVFTMPEDLGALLISTKQPEEYWLGRLTALSDRFRTEVMMLHPPIITSSGSSVIDASNMHDDGQRINHIFKYLHTLCSTQEAKDNLKDFEVSYRKKVFGDVGPHGPGKKAREKKGVFERMMGKKGGAGK